MHFYGEDVGKLWGMHTISGIIMNVFGDFVWLQPGLRALTSMLAEDCSLAWGHWPVYWLRTAAWLEGTGQFAGWGCQYGRGISVRERGDSGALRGSQTPPWNGWRCSTVMPCPPPFKPCYEPRRAFVGVKAFNWSIQPLIPHGSLDCRSMSSDNHLSQSARPMASSLKLKGCNMTISTEKPVFGTGVYGIITNLEFFICMA